jgi:phosphatidylserine/phosphatidylglycerophosphate/cardiolipin synthase-like enzyme
MNAALLTLPASDFPTLIAALRSGRLSPPYTTAFLEQLLGHSISAGVIQSLTEFQSFNFSEKQLALVLELIHQDRRSRPRLEDSIDLVTSGPEARGLANRDTRVVVREMFANAQSSVLVAGYAVHQGKWVFQALADRMQNLPQLRVRLFLDIQREPSDTTVSSLVVRRFADRFRSSQWPGARPLPEVFYDPRSLEIDPREKSALHAKCIVIDGDKSFISSANFTEAAQERNIEVGLLIKSTSLAGALSEYFDGLLAQGYLLPICF